MSVKRLGVEAALVESTVVVGDVLIEEDTIVAVGAEPAGRSGIAIPGFIDLQVNGFGGIDFMQTDQRGFTDAGEVLASTGVTSYQPTLITAPETVLISCLEVVAKARIESRPRILGVHLEGPFISPTWKGAHDERFIVDPDIPLAERLLETGPITYTTIAPERPGGFELLDRLVRHGIVVAVGHTDADAETAHRAFNRGARAVTHLYNAQRRFGARDPGIVGVSLTRSDVTVGVIADFVHLARETVLLTWRAARGRIALVTDAIQVAPLLDGEVTLAGRKVHVEGGAARLADGTLAGSALSMDRAVRNIISLGIPWQESVAAATSIPARLVSRGELGTLRPMTPADIAVLDDDYEIVRTVVAGEEIWAA